MKIIYADKIDEIAFNSTITKLYLGCETAENEVTHTAVLIIPTAALFENIDNIKKALEQNNGELNDTSSPAQT